uniref:Uncharacterized protein n=1 Tax=Ascaris lumbricoides TaxID=6252 RepID=A0A0M3HSS8_ASCLU
MGGRGEVDGMQQWNECAYLEKTVIMSDVLDIPLHVVLLLLSTNLAVGCCPHQNNVWNSNGEWMALYC